MRWTPRRAAAGAAIAGGHAPPVGRSGDRAGAGAAARRRGTNCRARQLSATPHPAAALTDIASPQHYLDLADWRAGWVISTAFPVPTRCSDSGRVVMI